MGHFCYKVTDSKKSAYQGLSKNPAEGHANGKVMAATLKAVPTFLLWHCTTAFRIYLSPSLSGIGHTQTRGAWVQPTTAAPTPTDGSLPPPLPRGRWSSECNTTQGPSLCLSQAPLNPPPSFPCDLPPCVGVPPGVAALWIAVARAAPALVRTKPLTLQAGLVSHFR